MAAEPAACQALLMRCAPTAAASPEAAGGERGAAGGRRLGGARGQPPAGRPRPQPRRSLARARGGGRGRGSASRPGARCAAPLPPLAARLPVPARPRRFPPGSSLVLAPAAPLRSPRARSARARTSALTRRPQSVPASEAGAAALPPRARERSAFPSRGAAPCEAGLGCRRPGHLMQPSREGESSVAWASVPPASLTQNRGAAEHYV